MEIKDGQTVFLKTVSRKEEFTEVTVEATLTNKRFFWVTDRDGITFDSPVHISRLSRQREVDEESDNW